MPVEPKQIADTCFSRAKRQLYLSLQAGIATRLRARPDLRRLTLVLGVAALDAYMHALVLARLSYNRRHGKLPKSLLKLDISFSDLAHLADATLQARSSNVRSRPWVIVRYVLQRRLMRETFQSFDQVSRAMGLAGVERGWVLACTKLARPIDEVKTTLDRIVHRRNQIVHEGDVLRQDRPQRLRLNPVVLTSVRDDLFFLEHVVSAIDSVVAEQAE